MDHLTLALGSLLIIASVFLVIQLKPRLISVRQGEALVRRRKAWLPGGGTTVWFWSTHVIKLFDRVEKVDLTRRHLRYDVDGKTKDGERFTISGELAFTLPQTEKDLLAVCEEPGVEVLNNPEALKSLFADDFRDATRRVAEKLEAEKLPAMAEDFRFTVSDVLGSLLPGVYPDTHFIDLKFQ